MQKRCLSDLTIKNDFMFGAVMINPENCKEFLERALEIEIDRVDVSREKSMVYHPDYKGIRLDVYAKDENNTCYNVEMQMTKKPALGRRSRYYQSQMDMDILLSGREYAELPDSYVIFICGFDPFGERKYRYTFRTICEETEKASLKDGRCIVFLNTCGRNEENIPQELLSFLKFVHVDLKESQKDFQDDYVRQVQKSVTDIKASREMEERFMLLEELLKDEHRQGVQEGIQKGELKATREILEMTLVKFGQLPDDFLKMLHEQQDMGIIKSWIQTALTVQSLDEFISKIC